MGIDNILHNLPEVRGPQEKKLAFNTKLKWTFIIIVAFFILANIPVYGLSGNALSRFQYLAIIFGTEFGSIISLGIGPIVMASIILQLLVGAKILDIDVRNPEGKKYFQGLQKLLVFAFIIFEAMVYVLMGGIQAVPGLGWLVILQLCLGGLLIMFMDEVTNKWGFGSGVSLFIAAGVGWRLFAALFQFIGTQGNFEISGRVLLFITSLISGDPTGATKALIEVLATIVIFLAVVWAQSLKVEVPLSFDRIRGYGIKWPLKFFYTSNMPVILVAALAANFQLIAGLIQNWLGHATWLGGFSNGTPISGFAYWIHSTPLLDAIVTGSFRYQYLLQGIGHVVFYVTLAIVFALFWVNTSGMDASSQARNILSSGLQIPGFRRDERVLESVLKRYITPLTIMGGAAVGLLASVADIMGALVGGTAILLSVMIIYQFYENIAQQHAVDMHPALKGMFGG
jgi:preprotein translocase subunit SecY